MTVFSLLLGCSGLSGQTMTAYMCPGGQPPQQVSLTLLENPAEQPEQAPAQAQQTPEPPPDKSSNETIVTRFTPPEPPADEREYGPQDEFNEPMPLMPPQRFFTGPTIRHNRGVGVGTGTAGLVGPTATVDNVGWSAPSLIAGGAGISPTVTQGAGGAGMP